MLAFLRASLYVQRYLWNRQALIDAGKRVRATLDQQIRDGSAAL
jgi:hypothetical protein